MTHASHSTDTTRPRKKILPPRRKNSGFILEHGLYTKSELMLRLGLGRRRVEAAIRRGLKPLPWGGKMLFHGRVVIEYLTTQAQDQEAARKRK